MSKDSGECWCKRQTRQAYRIGVVALERYWIMNDNKLREAAELVCVSASLASDGGVGQFLKALSGLRAALKTEEEESCKRRVPNAAN